MSKKRLDYLYQEGKTIEFDNNSKLVFISDVHRGDGTYFDSLLPNRNIYLTALKYYNKNDFTYIEVGDGDELWKNRNYNEISYSYEEVFKLLNKFNSKNKIYMIYGNHDIIKRKKNFRETQIKSLRKVGDTYAKEFINFIDTTMFYECLNLIYTPLQEKILVTHGHQVDFYNDELWFINRFLVRYLWKFLSGVAGFKDFASSAKSRTKRSLVDLELQNWARDKSIMVICGHTHNSRFPEKFEPPYFNDGCCILPDSMTAIEIEKGNISLVKWSVDAQDEGILWVKRKVIGGPRRINDYLCWAKEERNRLIEYQK